LIQYLSAFIANYFLSKKLNPKFPAKTIQEIKHDYDIKENLNEESLEKIKQEYPHLLKPIQSLEMDE
jgi:hypothetical protein